jgi:RNA polymerase sigma factor (sigma-70 family)
MNTDADLLRRYVHERDEPAFAELVQRHLGLVYSVALRRVGGDAHLAEDVTQRVFAVLARKALTLVGRPTLSGWLYTTAHLTSAVVVRGERRRKVHESEAQLMQNTLSSSEPAADWTRLRPVIDDVMIALKEDDREAIALRFFEKRSFVEVGAALRVTEEAARKRVDRALEKLRTLLMQRGITSTTAALGIALPAFAAIDSPAGLGGKVARHALASAPAKPWFAPITQALWPAMAVLATGSLVLVAQQRANDALRAEIEARVSSKTALASLLAENQQLAKSIAAVSDFETRTDALKAPISDEEEKARFDAGLPTRSPIITVTAAGTLAWDDDTISPAEFDLRVDQLRIRQVRDPRVGITIRSLGDTALPQHAAALSFVFDRVRRAGIQNVSAVNTPKSQVGWWF